MPSCLLIFFLLIIPLWTADAEIDGFFSTTTKVPLPSDESLHEKNVPFVRQTKVPTAHHHHPSIMFFWGSLRGFNLKDRFATAIKYIEFGRLKRYISYDFFLL